MNSCHEDLESRVDEQHQMVKKVRHNFGDLWPTEYYTKVTGEVPQQWQLSRAKDVWGVWQEGVVRPAKNGCPDPCILELSAEALTGIVRNKGLDHSKNHLDTSGRRSSEVYQKALKTSGVDVKLHDPSGNDDWSECRTVDPKNVSNRK